MNSKLFFVTILLFFLEYSCATLTSSALNPVKSALSPPSNQIGNIERKLSNQQVSNPMKTRNHTFNVCQKTAKFVVRSDFANFSNESYNNWKRAQERYIGPNERLREYILKKAKQFTNPQPKFEHIELNLQELLVTQLEVKAGIKEIDHDGQLRWNKWFPSKKSPLRESQGDFAVDFHRQEVYFQNYLHKVDRSDVQLLGIAMYHWIFPSMALQTVPNIYYFEWDHHEEDIEAWANKLKHVMDVEINNLDPSHFTISYQPSLYELAFKVFGKRSMNSTIRLILFTRALLEPAITGKGVENYLKHICTLIFGYGDLKMVYVKMLEKLANQIDWEEKFGPKHGMHENVKPMDEENESESNHESHDGNFHFHEIIYPKVENLEKNNEQKDSLDTMHLPICEQWQY